MKNLSLLFYIINPNDKKFLKFLNKYKIKFKTIINATGTASSSLLDYFGLNEIDKILILSIVPTNYAKYILMEMTKKLSINEPGKGIAFTIPISSSTKYLLDMYNDIEMEDIKMETSNKHLIITIASEGYAESIMNAAKKAGASGGTSISGRGLETDKIVKFLGMSIEPEKDIVLILTDSEKKTNIMNQIVESCGLKTLGAGICFSIPVDNVVGLDKEIIKDAQ